MSDILIQSPILHRQATKTWKARHHFVCLESTGFFSPNELNYIIHITQYYKKFCVKMVWCSLVFNEENHCPADVSFAVVVVFNNLIYLPCRLNKYLSDRLSSILRPRVHSLSFTAPPHPHPIIHSCPVFNVLTLCFLNFSEY